TQTVCPSCVGGVLPTPVYPVVHTCSSCAPVTLTNTAIWLYTPAPGSDYAVPAPTLAPHPQKGGSVTVNPAATYTATTYGAPCMTCGFVTKSVVPGYPSPTA